MKKRGVLTFRIVWSAVAYMTATSCVTQDQSIGHRGLPTLSQIRSRVVSPHPRDNPPSEQPVVLAQVTAVYFSLQNRLARRVWASIDEAALASSETHAWRDNGIRVGVLKETRLGAFVETLPTSSIAPIRWVTIPASATPVPVSPVVNRPIRFFLANPDGQHETVRLTSGRLQLLARAVPDEETGGVLELTPHVYEPRTTLQPRTPQEKALDGRVLDWLTLHVPLRLDGLLVMGLYTPKTNTDDENGSDDDDDSIAKDIPDPMQSADTVTDQGPATDVDSSATPQQRPIPDHLGKFMFTASRLGKPVQTMLLIRLAPWDDLIIDEIEPALQD